MTADIATLAANSAAAPFTHPKPCNPVIVGCDRRSRPIRQIPIVCRIARSVVVTPDGCWENTLCKNDSGYAAFSGNLAHRFMYELLVGPIPAGLTIDHLCRNPPCCNPQHLEPVTLAENSRRGIAARFRGRCSRGHDGPWYQRPDGRRECCTCRDERRALRRHSLVCSCPNGRCTTCRARRLVESS